MNSLQLWPSFGVIAKWFINKNTGKPFFVLINQSFFMNQSSRRLHAFLKLSKEYRNFLHYLFISKVLSTCSRSICLRKAQLNEIFLIAFTEKQCNKVSWDKKRSIKIDSEFIQPRLAGCNRFHACLSNKRRWEWKLPNSVKFLASIDQAWLRKLMRS